MNHIVLYEPEIPQNTGNIIRLCANTGFTLHLIEPLGFTFNSSKMRRAGLDYQNYTTTIIHKTWHNCLDCFANNQAQFYALSTKGHTRYDSPQFHDGDVFVFGPETRGLPRELLKSFFTEETILRLPMHVGMRSLNLANTVAVIAFEVWRQQNFKNGV